MPKLLDILKESMYLPNPEEKKYMLSIQKNEKYSNFLTKAIKKNPLVKEIEVIEYPIDKYNETPTYKINIHVDTTKMKDVTLDLENIGNDLYFLLGKVLNNSLKLRGRINFEFHNAEN
jgi:hypothetical protein